MPDPLSAPQGSSPVVTYIINVLFQIDCAICALVTGRRNTTISCMCGLCEEGQFGRGWYWGMCWIWGPVNLVARVLFGQIDHCVESVGPFLVEEDAP